MTEGTNKEELGFESEVQQLLDLELILYTAIRRSF